MEFNMEKSYSKIWVIVALVISVLALSIGFAAFSTSLVVNENENVTVTPFDNFKNTVVFDASSVNCTVSKGNDDSGASVEATGTFDSNSTVWQGLKVKLTTPGDKVTCTVGIKNNGEYNAYLKSVKFNTLLSCSSTTAGNVYTAQICAESGINASAKVSGYQATVNKVTQVNKTGIASNNELASKGSSSLEVVIDYPSSAPFADEDVNVTIPQITLDYSSSNS